MGTSTAWVSRPTSEPPSAPRWTISLGNGESERPMAPLKLLPSGPVRWTQPFAAPSVRKLKRSRWPIYAFLGLFSRSLLFAAVHSADISPSPSSPPPSYPPSTPYPPTGASESSATSFVTVPCFPPPPIFVSTSHNHAHPHTPPHAHIERSTPF